MAYADKIFKEMCGDIMNNGVSTEGQDIRTRWDDGSPAHTIKRFGVVNRYDLSKEFPILTLRKTNWKASLDEILWIFQKQSNNTKDLNSKIWDLWTDEDGSIGKAYGYQLQTEPTKQIVSIKPRLYNKHKEIAPIKVAELQPPNTNCNHKFCGKILKSNNCGEFMILDVLTKNSGSTAIRLDGDYNTEVVVQFLETGYIRKSLLENVKKGKIKDIYSRTVHNVGYYGDISNLKNVSNEYVEVMFSKWRQMLRRCYDINDAHYGYYGEKGVFVSERWHSFENYICDTIRLPQYQLAKRDNFKDWQIDKDYYSSNCYSKDTCVWLSKRDNVMYSNNRPYILYFPKSEKQEVFLCVKDAIEKYGLTKNINDVLRGVYKDTCGGYMAKYLDDGNIYRYQLASNQVDDVLYALKHDRNSRRIMTNFWNPKDAPEKALMECAYSLTFNVVGDKLNVILNQRSSDVLVANNWNVVQYALLTHMLAQVSNLQVGEFIHVISDAHLYTKHISLTEELLTREEYLAPKLIINPNIKDFYDFTVDDFQIIDYKHGEQIKNIPIAI